MSLSKCTKQFSCLFEDKPVHVWTFKISKFQNIYLAQTIYHTVLPFFFNFGFSNKMNTSPLHDSEYYMASDNSVWDPSAGICTQRYAHGRALRLLQQLTVMQQQPRFSYFMHHLLRTAISHDWSTPSLTCTDNESIAKSPTLSHI